MRWAVQFAVAALHDVLRYLAWAKLGQQLQDGFKCQRSPFLSSVVVVVVVVVVVCLPCIDNLISGLPLSW